MCDFIRSNGFNSVEELKGISLLPKECQKHIRLLFPQRIPEGEVIKSGFATIETTYDYRLCRLIDYNYIYENGEDQPFTGRIINYIEEFECDPRDLEKFFAYNYYKGL